MRRHQVTYGFTLIEMLLALALTTVLLTIVSVTIGAVARDNERLKSMDSSPSQLEPVVDILRQDLQQSTTYQMTDGILTLHGHSDVTTVIQGASGVIESGHDPVVIEYEVLDLGNVYWLVRRINAIEAPPTQEPVVELLCGGVSSWKFAIATTEGDETIPDHETLVEGSSSHTAAHDTMSPIPDQVTVSFTLTATNHEHASIYNDYPSQPRQHRPDPDQLHPHYLIVIR